MVANPVDLEMIEIGRTERSGNAWLKTEKGFVSLLLSMEFVRWENDRAM